MATRLRGEHPGPDPARPPEASTDATRPTLAPPIGASRQGATPMTTTSQHFPRDIAGLPAARATEIIELAHGERVELRIAPVTKRIGDATVRMLAYNSSIPGPTLRVPEGAELVIDVENEGDLEGT